MKFTTERSLREGQNVSFMVRGTDYCRGGVLLGGVYRKGILLWEMNSGMPVVSGRERYAPVFWRFWSGRSFSL